MIKKREITITILIALICVAGYVNWNYQKQEKDAPAMATAQDSPKTTGAQTNVTQTSGNANAVSDQNQPAENNTGYFSEDQINKDKSKSESIDLLNKIIANENSTAEAKAKAQDSVLFLSKSIEMENRAQTLLKAKGFVDTNVLISQDVVNVIIKTSGLSPTDVTKIRDIASEVSGFSYDSIKIIEVKK